ncbi:MAG: mechanosensitive ion channel family protein [Cyanobacteriota bacterium]|nr:mechanosensitive ion channel family protein [Cyanobacteriota bacterium]
MITRLELPQFFLQIEPPIETQIEPPIETQIDPTVTQGWDVFLSNLVVAAVLGVVLYVALFFVLGWLFRRLDNQVGILSLSVSRGPIIILFALISLKIAFANLEGWVLLPLLQKVLTALSILVVSYLVAQLFTEVLAYYLKKYAEKSEATWDDVLVPLLENTLPAIIYLLGAFLFLQALGVDLTWLSLLFTGISFGLSFALQDILKNFFSSLVLLVDTPFQYGDVIQLSGGDLAVIKNIGIRLTKLYLIDTNCELFVPNGNLQSQNLINLSRPTPNYYYTIGVPFRGDIDPIQSIKIIEEVIMGHPDTLGDISQKLVAIEDFYRARDQLLEEKEGVLSKREAGKLRLETELQLNSVLDKITSLMIDLSKKIQVMERSGLDAGEAREIQGYYLDIVKLAGLDMVSDRQTRRKSVWLEESPSMDENTLISLLRTWYQNWSKDPDLSFEDADILEEEWERRLDFMKLRMNNLLQKISKAGKGGVNETKLDDYLQDFILWLEENFKNTNTLWQEPKIWVTNVNLGGGGSTSNELTVKFFVDNIKLEQCQRGYRVKSEVQGEIMRRLRQSYLYR